MSFDIDQGEIKNMRSDGGGEYVADAEGFFGNDGVRVRQPMGLQSRLVDGREADALIYQDGPVCEVLAAVDRQAAQELPELDKGQTRIHSVDKSPQLISILSTLIGLGRNAKKGVVREDDKLDLGTIVFAFTPPAGTPPVFELTITYTDAIGSAPVVIGPIAIVGGGAAQPSYTIKLRGKAIDWSALVKSE